MISLGRVILYLFLLLLYLGLSKVTSPAGIDTTYIFNNASLKKHFSDKLISVILIDYHSTGFIIKTHYHKYRIVYGYKSFQEKVVRVSSSFKKRHLENIGTSIFRRDAEGNESFVSLPPGAVFIGNSSFGSWQKADKEIRKWKFYRVYKHLVDFLGWGSFVPEYTDYQKIQVAINQNKRFLGPDNIFGTNGKQAQKSFPRFFKRKSPQLDYKKFLKDYFKGNYYRKDKVSL